MSFWFLTLTIRNDDGTELSKHYEKNRNSIQEVIESLKKLSEVSE